MIIFDVETTGLPKPDAAPLKDQPQIIEFAAIKLSDEEPYEELSTEINGHDVPSRMDFLVDPGVPLPEIITKITGLTDKDVQGQPRFPAHYPNIVDFFQGERNLIAHNVEFDCTLLKFELMRIQKALRFPWPYNRIDTVAASYYIKGHRLKLELLVEHITGETHTGTHRAMADVEDLVMATRWLLDEGRITLG